MLVKTQTPTPKSHLVSGQWGGGGKEPLMTFNAYMSSIQAMLDGPLQIQSNGEYAAVITRSFTGEEEPDNEITVRAIRMFFGVPANNNDSPPVEIRAQYIIAGTISAATPVTNAAQFYTDYQAVFSNANATLDDAANFLSNYWKWPVEYSMMVLANHGISEQ